MNAVQERHYTRTTHTCYMSTVQKSFKRLLLNFAAEQCDGVKDRCGSSFLIRSVRLQRAGPPCQSATVRIAKVCGSDIGRHFPASNAAACVTKYCGTERSDHPPSESPTRLNQCMSITPSSKPRARDWLSCRNGSSSQIVSRLWEAVVSHCSRYSIERRCLHG